MTTRRQKEFRKQMKALEKEGKLPDNYYSRRSFKYTGGGISILLVLFVLWQSGILGMILSPFFMFLNGGQTYADPSQVINNSFSSPESAAISAYYNVNIDTEEFISNVYIDIYKHFYENKSVTKEAFTAYQEAMISINDHIETEQEFLKDLAVNYQESLAATSDMLDFALAHYDNPLTKDEKQYLDTLSKKSQLLSDKRSNLWAELEKQYE